MEPEFNDGDIIVSPTAKPVTGDYIVAKNDEEDATFKQYKKFDTTRVLHPLNPKYPDIVLNKDLEYRIVGVVMKDRSEVDIVLRQYNDKLYTFISPEDKEDEHIRDIISIALVRIAQRGNMSAKQEIIRLMAFTIDDWIERNPNLYSWRGYDPLIQVRIECCIRRYRYSGSFMRYVFKTLEYAARGLKPLIACSLDDVSHFRNRC